MFLSRALERSLAPPDWLSINLTLRCNLRCTMCTTCYEVAEELTTEEILDVIDQAALWGVRVLNPLGGEPFVRTDLEAILLHAARKDFHITLTTNGTLITWERAAKLARIPPEKLHMSFSLDGLWDAHDSIRGQGSFERTMAGYRQLRRADADAHNPRRKVLANTLVHAQNLHELPELLDKLAEEGFDGVQLLNLFRRPPETGAPVDTEREAEVARLWIGPDQMPALERLVEQLRERVRHPPWPFFRIQNPETDIELLPSYYRDQLQPLEAPCWAGWKELYVNADGSVIMCDGNLDFLAGRFGSVREQTLQQLWASPALRERRRVVKRCSTPCIQNCYLRRSSDRLTPLVGRAAKLGVESLVQRLPERPRPVAEHQALPDGVLTLELTDTCDCTWQGCPTPSERMGALVQEAPGPMATCYDQPRTWHLWRDRHYVDFGRGFMGLELVKRITDDLRVHGPAIGTIALRWRGEPLLHPEIIPVMKHLIQVVGSTRPFGRLRIHTNALLLSEDLVDIILGHPEAPTEWWLDLDRMGEHQQDAWQHLERWNPRLREPALVAGQLASAGGDAYWLRRADPHSFVGDQAAERALRSVAAAVEASLELPDTRQPRRCPGPIQTPVISWDGKVTLCPWDTGIENQVGEVTSGKLSNVWSSDRLKDLRRDVASRGVPGLTSCRDCHQMFSPSWQF